MILLLGAVLTFGDLWATRVRPPPYGGVATEFSNSWGSDGRRIFPWRDKICAHRDEPIGSWLRITNVENGLSVVCQVRDRGPNRKFWPRREVDLSPPASRAIRCNGYCRVIIDREPAP